MSDNGNTAHSLPLCSSPQILIRKTTMSASWPGRDRWLIPLWKATSIPTSHISPSIWTFKVTSPCNRKPSLLRCRVTYFRAQALDAWFPLAHDAYVQYVLLPVYRLRSIRSSFSLRLGSIRSFSSLRLRSTAFACYLRLCYIRSSSFLHIWIISQASSSSQSLSLSAFSASTISGFLLNLYLCTLLPLF